MMKFNLLTVLLFFAIHLAGQSPIGTWKTVDDGTQTEKSHVQIYEQDGKLFGKITKLLDAEPGVVCENCKGKKHNQPVLGMVIIEDLEPHKDYWKSGNIMDPENGNTYGCSIWFEEGNADELKVRGKHWTGFYRTQTWYKVK